MDWCCDVEHHSKNRVMLLTAVAGAGKSAVAHTIAHLCNERDILLSCFFFRAGETTSPDHLWSGIARSLAIRNQSYRRILASTLKKDPTIATAASDDQFKKLVLEPLRRIPPPDDRPLVIVIDAFDECDRDASTSLAELLRNSVSELPSSVKFFVTSRCTTVVDRYLLRNPSPISHVNIHLSDDNNLEDCKVYIRSEVPKLKALFPAIQDDWPSNLEETLAARARGLFIWASTVMKYLKNESVNPVAALNDLMDGASQDVPAEEYLDALYTTILKKCNWRDNSFKCNYPIVMGAIMTARSPLSIIEWEALLSPFLFPHTSVEDTISELRPLLTGADQRSTPIQLLHQSFRDYLKGRSASHVPVTLAPPKDQERLALRCFQMFNTEIPKVAGLGIIEKLGERDVIPTIPHEEISGQLAYACRFGWDHMLEIQEVSEVLGIEIKKFSENFVDWLEFCIRTEKYSSILPLFDWIEVS